ncbi:non-specific serine/threonine protein kinase [Luteibacter rhizovicinus]|uniref:Non-specific serine/threonine protein kinase n=1 Tax=Luteibacter rhizovicinus TaxID=242606 RepID=A0A4R3YTS2_9GAMM|nr:SUMF1/EgtB/PvdO family nonheme iron enzyme [Luteibacter rhizovicinus]TCV95832.1 non-specific serine/threonine protein kinase [Luteibacter rhizovicinus]
MYDSASVVELVTALRSGKLDLAAVLGALESRGALHENEYLAGVETLRRLREEDGIGTDDAITLVTRLDALRAAPAPEEDATVVKPTARTSPPSLVDDDATVVMPRSRAVPLDADDITRVQPAAAVPSAPSGTHVGLTGTHSHSTSSLESWQRIADAAGGDYATVGSLLKGRFYLERELGRGGMGVVFLARDDRKVEARDRDPWLAVKVLNDEFRRHPDSLVALQRESRRSQKLAHDNIVRVFDFDKDGTNVFMTMEYIDGCDLKTLIREQAYNGMPLSRARPLIDGMARALGRAHAAGVVHSDFKPGNVMVTREGIPKVFDFGIARAGKHMGDASGEQTVFDAATLGALTPAYASLEMIRGQLPSPGDDIYALGCVVFELLTGKHPFDKLSAEVAMREDRKPPAVAGLTRRQYGTLCQAVAFTSEHRLNNVDALLEGLRDIGLKERLLPVLGYGVAALAVLAGGSWGAVRYLHGRHVTEVSARFAPNDPQHYRDEDQALQALSSLDDDDRRRLLDDRGDAIQNFLLSRIDARWNPPAGRYDYAGALHVFAMRDRMRLYAPTLDGRREAMERQRNALLNTFDTDLGRQIAAGAIFGNDADNAAATLAKIHAIEPDSTLLKNPELELAYDEAIGQSLAAGRRDEARGRLAVASQWFPSSLRLQLRAVQVDVADRAYASKQLAAQPAASTHDLAEARDTLAGLVAKPSLDPAWQAAVASTMETLSSDTAPETHRLADALGVAIANAASQQTDPLHLQQDLALVDFGLRFAPKSEALLGQQSRLDALQQALMARLDKDSADAEVTARIESVHRAATVNDVTKARDALSRIRALQPGNAFLSGDGPQLLAGAYLGQAKDVFQQGQYQRAADMLGQGTETLGNRLDLRAAKARYDVVAAIMGAGEQRLADADYARIKMQLDGLYRSDAAGMTQLEKDLKTRGKLPEGTLSARLDRLMSTDAAPAAATSTAVATEATGVARAARRKVAPVTATVAAGTAPVAEAGPRLPDGPDPCGDPDMVGRGKFCFDQVDGHRGPALVVIPGIDGGHPYALSRAEITVAEFNRFCAATGQCSAVTVDDQELGRLPMDNIGVAQARAYASWLTKASGGWPYRLPTDAEWIHAAQAGSGWRQAEDSNCIPPKASAGDGTGAPVSARGREANPWGLVNMAGNVWEWVTLGGTLMVRGGSFTSYWSECTVEARREDKGAAQKDVGFRLMRDLK